MHLATYTGTPGLYKNQEYEIAIEHSGDVVRIRRKCGAGKMYYPNYESFLKEWTNVRKIEK